MDMAINVFTIVFHFGLNHTDTHRLSNLFCPIIEHDLHTVYTRAYGDNYAVKPGGRPRF